MKVDLLGQRFGRLVVTACYGSIGGKMNWICACDCGKSTRVDTGTLRFGRTKSCGCLGIEARALATAAANRTHGKSRTPTYEVWFNMKRRCCDPRHKSFKHYGGRGIQVCDRWLKFENFLADMGERPDGLSIERKDSNGHYEPTNCIWATQKTQQNNRRSNRFIEAFGRRQTMQQWSDERGVTPDAIAKRLDAGWTHEDAVSLPMRPDRRRDGARVWTAV